MYIVSIQEVLELNELIEKAGLKYKIHLKDGCGGQTMRMEEIEGCKKENSSICKVIEGYFANKRVDIEFSDNKEHIRIK